MLYSELLEAIVEHSTVSSKKNIFEETLNIILDKPAKAVLNFHSFIQRRVVRGGFNLLPSETILRQIRASSSSPEFISFATFAGNRKLAIRCSDSKFAFLNMLDNEMSCYDFPEFVSYIRKNEPKSDNNTFQIVKNTSDEVSIYLTKTKMLNRDWQPVLPKYFIPKGQMQAVLSRMGAVSDEIPDEEEPPFDLTGCKDVSQSFPALVLSDRGTGVLFSGSYKPYSAQVHIKQPEDKIRLDLVEPSFIKAVGKVRTYGLKAYPDEQGWRNEPKQRFIAATMRHFEAYRSGEILDPESNMPHLWHAACNLMFLIEMENSTS